MIHHEPGKTRKHVWSLDAALDKSDEEGFKAAWEKFLKDDDVAALPLVEGDAPTVFDLEPLSRKAFTAVMKLDGLEQASEAVAYGLCGVTGFHVKGKPFTIERKETNGSARLTAKTMDAIYDPFLFMELGYRVIAISRIDPTRGQG